MPTLFERSGSALPYDAYREACLAPSPKNGAPWSHAAVYLAGRDSGGFSSPTNLKIKAGRFIVSTTSDGSAGRQRGGTARARAGAALTR